MGDDLDEQTMHLLRKTFAVADSSKSGSIEVAVLAASLTNAGISADPAQLQEAVSSLHITDGKVNFNTYVLLASSFMEEDDEETIIGELKEAFRLYDREGNGYITTKCLREILRELDHKITERDMDEIIADMGLGPKGHIDFENFKDLML